MQYTHCDAVCIVFIHNIAGSRMTPVANCTSCKDDGSRPCCDNAKARQLSADKGSSCKKYSTDWAGATEESRIRNCCFVCTGAAVLSASLVYRKMLCCRMDSSLRSTILSILRRRRWEEGIATVNTGRYPNTRLRVVSPK